MNKLNFLSYNANGLGSSKKRIKVFEYLKKKMVLTHSSEDKSSEWKDNFAGKIFFSYGTTNSCGIMIGYHGNENFNEKKNK